MKDDKEEEDVVDENDYIQELDQEIPHVEFMNFGQQSIVPKMFV